MDEVNEMIKKAGWFNGTISDWRNMPDGLQKEIAFRATGCQVAFPTWPAPVKCLHPQCRLRRGEIRPIRITNSTLRFEAQFGYLRLMERKKRAAVMRWIRRQARKTGIYDPWKMPGGWQAIVYGGLLG